MLGPAFLKPTVKLPQGAAKEGHGLKTGMQSPSKECDTCSVDCMDPAHPGTHTAPKPSRPGSFGGGSESTP